MKLPEWPSSPPSAVDMRTYYATWGLFAHGQTVGMLDLGLGGLNDRIEVGVEVVSNFQVAMLLDTLLEADEAFANHAAVKLWMTSESGQTYEELLSEWVEQGGVDSESVIDLGVEVTEELWGG